MKESKATDKDLALDDMAKRFHGVELQLRRLELDKLDYLRSVKKLVQAFSLLLGRHSEFTPEKEVLINDFLGALTSASGALSPAFVGEFAHQLIRREKVLDDESSDVPIAPKVLDNPFGLPIPPGPSSGMDSGDSREDNVYRDPHFMDFLKDLSSFRGNRYLDDAKNLGRLIELGISVRSFLGNLGPLLLRFIRDCGDERQDISVKLSGIIKTLINLEGEFKEFLEKSIYDLDVNNRDFTMSLSKHVSRIKERIDEARVDGEPESLIRFIASEVESISDTIRRKNEDDSLKLASLHAEKTALESSLDTVRRDYDSFVKQSHRMLRELEEMRSIALKDGLTGVFNRRAYDEQLLLTLLNYKAGKLITFSLIIFDLDNFRDVNNNYGHQAGDKILVSLAEIATSSLRSSDFVFRYGGDEFVVLLPDANLHSAAKVAEKIRSAVDGVEFQLWVNKPDFIKVSVSMGVSEVHPDDNPGSILSRADKALYESKKGGRNRVSLEEEGGTGA